MEQNSPRSTGLPTSSSKCCIETARSADAAISAPSPRIQHGAAKRLSRQALLASLLAIASGTLDRAHAADEAQSSQQQLCVMTFNLRYASPRPPNSWPERRPVTAACIRSVQPDLIGTQEGLYPQIKDLASDLPDYSWIGLGRDGGSRGEFMAVFYRTSRFEPQEYDHFWLSDTPNVVGSSTWGNSNRRMVTWVRFKERESGKEFFFLNTHLDHEIQVAREKAAALIRERVLALKTELPILLVGDFNAEAGANPAYSTLVSDELFTDTWTTAAQRRGELVNTFHGYRPVKTTGVRIDWILARGPIVPEATQIIQFSQGDQFPSDHFPVAAWLRWGTARSSGDEQK